VLINAAIDNLDFPCVATDDLSAASQAFGHLTALGHERIGLVPAPRTTCRRYASWPRSATTRHASA
jgi:DNA-binding LacI/PurR family transcriptional regulator